MAQEKDQKPASKKDLIEGQAVLIKDFEPTVLSVRQGEVIIVPKDFLTTKKLRFKS